MILPIRLYQFTLAKILPPSCLYEPSCSSYTAGSIMKHGFVKGFILGATRIFRCNAAFFTGGNDPVPETFSFKQIRRSYYRFSRARLKRK